MDINQITYFAETDARNKKIKFGIKAKDRLKHMYVIGKTGMGKSTLLENMAIQDISNGNGLAVIDPHGSFAEKLLDYIPEHRVSDVLYFAPFDMEYPVSFNVMEDVGKDKRHLVVNGLMSTFEKIWADAWSARMSYILQYTIIALLEYPGSTLLGINRMLSDKEYRKKVVENVTDPATKSFWIDEFGKYTEKFAAEATPAIQNKVGQFTSNPLVRNIIGQSASSFDVRKIMDEKKIFIVNLSKGRVGEGNANLIGSMLITKIYLAAMSRADLNEAEISKLPNFYLYVDEFQSFANKSFADILSEARKYKLNLTIAHQYIEQMDEDVRNAVFGNVGTMVTFRVGAFDAEVLEKEFSPTFTAEDLVNLGFTQIYLKLMIDGVASRPFSATTMAPIPKPEISFKNQSLEYSRKNYSKERVLVEKEIEDFFNEMKSSTNITVSKNSKPDIRYDNFKKPNDFPRQQSVSAPVVSTVVPTTVIGADPVVKQAEINSTTSTVPIIDKNREAFLKAKEELFQKEKNENNNMLVIPKSSDTFINNPQIIIDNKVPTQGNIKSLKDALSSVLNSNTKNTPSSVNSNDTKPVIKENRQTINDSNVFKKETNLPDSQQKKDANVDQNNKSVLDGKPDFPEKLVKEVPEDVLKSLLSME